MGQKPVKASQRADSGLMVLSLSFDGNSNRATTMRRRDVLVVENGEYRQSCSNDDSFISPLVHRTTVPAKYTPLSLP